MLPDSFFEKLKEYVKKNIGEKGSHAFDHTKRVYQYALNISKDLNVDLDIVKASALLHDIGRIKEKKGNIKDHAAAGATEARNILKKMGFPKDKIEIVCKCIILHNKKEDLPEIKEVRVLKEADGLETLGAMGIAREFSFNGDKKQWTSTENVLSSIIKHCNADYFIIPKARRIANEKERVTRDFCTQFIKEYELKF